MSLYLKLLLKYIEIHRKSKRLRRIVFGLACMVVFVTVYQLIIPTITLTKKNADNMAGISTDDGKMTVLDCGLKVHQHDKSCYRMIKGKKTLVCGQADYVIHEHDDSCYAVDDKGKKVLVCELPEIEEHKHNDTCYDNEIILACGKEQSEGHTHTDECYKTETELICDQEEHLHDDSCYSEAENENGEISRVLTCKLKEHKHDKDCYQTSKVLICEKQEEEGHTHSDTCYETKKVLTCSESEPHKHTQKCYEKGHNGDAEYLICGKPELKAHQHTRKCFTRVQADHADDSDDPNSAEGETESENTETDTEIISDEVHQSDTEETEAVTGTPEEIDTEEGKDTGNDGNQRDSEFETEDESESNDTVEVSDTESEEEPSSETETPSTAAKDSGSTVEEIVFSRMLTDNTGIWRKTGEGGWVRIGKSTRLTRKENLMVRIAYSIPKGTLNNENAYVIYELPENLGVTWDIADRVNIKENHLNQIIEGTRLPDEKKESSENLAGYYEMAGVSDDKDESRFRLELQFNDYTISENASHDVEGWLVFYLKDAALEHGKDGTGRIVFSKKAVNGKKVTVSYIVEDEVSAGSEDDTRTSDETAATEKETETEETAENEETAEKESMQGDEQNPADPEKGITYPALDFQESTKKLTVSVQAEEGAFPLGTSLNVEDIEDKDTLDTVREAASEEADSANIKYIHAVDITFTDKNDREIEPLKPVRVSITCPETKGAEDAMVMHVDDEGDVQVVDQVDQAELTDTPADNEFIFDADSFPVFAVVGTTMEKTVLASDGNNYRVTVTYGPETGIPEEADLNAHEITEGSPAYEEYVAFAENALGWEAGSVSYARVFDISIVNKDNPDAKYQPADGTTVNVKVQLADAEKEKTRKVVHFADGSETGEVVENTEKGQTVEFTADGFSVYVIADHEGGDIITPRVEFHFLDSEYTEVAEGSGYTYSAGPYTFVNKAGEYQTSQILKDGEGLEQIANPKNKTNPDRYFYGWYVVDSETDPDASPTVYTWSEDPEKVLYETPISISIDGETVTWSLGEASGTGTVDEDGCVHVYLAPIYEDYYFVNFHIGPKEDLGTEEEPGLAHNLMTRKLIVLGSDGQAEIRIGNVQAPSPDAVHKIFAGWETVKTEGDELVSDQIFATLDSDGNEIPNPQGKDGYYITATEKKNIDLYPVFAEARWVYFHTGESGNGATYVGAKHLLTSDDVPEGEDSPYYFESLPVSQRNGYNFLGWYTERDGESNGTGDQITDENGNLINNYVKYDTDGTTKLYEIVNGKLYFYKAMTDLHLYAKWEEVPDTTYTVIIWQQKVTDDVNAYSQEEYDAWVRIKKEENPGITEEQLQNAASQAGITVRDYDYVSYSTIEGNSGKTLEELDISAFENNTYTGFHYGSTIMTTETVKGDGTTVVNVYYDRNIHTLRFYANGRGYTYTSTTSNDDVQYGFINGQPVQLTRKDAGQDKIWYFSYVYTWANRGPYRLYNDTHTYVNQNIQNAQRFNRGIGNVNNNRYTGSRYERSGTNYQNYIYSATDSETGQLFGLDGNGGYVELNSTTLPKYVWTYVDSNGVTRNYTGTRYTRSGSQTNGSNNMVYSITALYQQNIADIFPIVGTNGTTYDNGERWNPVNSSTYSQVLVFLDIMPDEDVRFEVNTSTNGLKVLTYYVETLPGEPVDSTRNGVNYKTYHVTNARYGYFTEAEDFFDIIGFTKKESNPPFVNGEAHNTNTIDLYYTRKTYNLTLDTNYPLDQVIYFDNNQWDQTYNSTVKENEVHQLLYEASLNEYGSTGTGYWEPKAPDHYYFDGWYEDATCTVPFDFNSTMPAANKVVYAKWTPETFRVHINPNGAEIDHIDHDGNPTFREELNYHYVDKATYINADYGTVISEYALTREYVPISDAVAQTMDEDDVYYYIYSKYYEDTGRGLPADLRNALYVKESELDSYYQYYRDLIMSLRATNPDRYNEVTILGPAAWRNAYVSTQKYRKKYQNEHYEFLGWYKDDDTMPYNFSDPVEESFTITAHWRLDGGYSVAYIPEYITPNGTHINGNIEIWQDPQGGATYADQAVTTILQQPTSLTANGTPLSDDSYIFRGWQLVSVGGTAENPIYTPLENGVYYQEGEEFVIEAKNANAEGIIYLQAVYEEKESSYRRPEIANLTLDANSGFITEDGETELAANKNLERIGNVGTVAADAENDQIIFGDLQSNIAVHVDDYAVDPNYFKHPNGYHLLGFDDEPDERDYIATYAADSIISVSRTDEDTIYAVWEPMIYLNLVNDTGVGDVTIRLNATDSTTLYVVNMATGEYERVAVTDLANITVKEGESIRLAIPHGAEKDITISGINELGPGQVLLWDSKVTVDDTTYDTYDNNTTEYSHTVEGNTHSHALAKGQIDNTEEFSFNETLIVDEEGLTVTFRAVQHDRTLVLHDNYRENTQEIYFANPLTTDGFDLPTPSTRIGYEFVGWDTERLPDNADQTPDYPVGTNISNVSEFFGEEQIQTLYAVWKAKAERGETYVYKLVPEPGDQNKEFVFTVSITGSYRRDSNGTETTISSSNNVYGNQLTQAFTLTHGQHLLITTSKDVGTANVSGQPWIQAVVQKFDGDDPDHPLETKTVRWQRSSAVSGTVTFDNLAFVNVIENDYRADYYDTNLEIAAETQEGELTTGQEDRKVSWTHTDAGGTVFYRNIRQTADVAVKKNLTGNTSVGTFAYTANYTLGESTTDLGAFNVTSNSETGYILEGIPVGAVLTISEADDDSYNVSTALENDSVDTNAADNTVSFTVPNGGETVTYTNVLKSFPVKILKVDQNGQGGVEARFDLSQDGANIVSGKYTTPTDNNIYDGSLYVGDYTLTETWTQDDYLGLNGPVGLTLSGDGTLVSDNSGAVVTGDAVNGFIVTVTNQATKEVTVKKVLDDPLISQRTFTFTATYTMGEMDEQDDPNETEQNIQTLPAFSILSSKSTPGTYVLTVPVGANLTVTEDTTGLDSIYDTTVSETGGESTVADAITIENVQNPTEIVFTNTRKTATITVAKQMSDATDPTSFEFTSALKNGSNPLSDYLVYTTPGMLGLTTVEHRTNSAGEVSYELSHGQSQEMTVPVGTILSIREDAGEFIAQTTSAAGIEDADTEDNQFTFTVSGDDTITFTNAPKGLPVILKKIGYNNTDESTWDLEGVTFKIYTDINKSSESLVILDEKSEFTSDENGLLYEGMLPTGTYYLDEINTPAGYIGTPGMYVLSVTNTEVTLNSTDTIGTPDLSDWITSETDSQTGITTFTITIRNTTGAELPYTGGSGTGRIYIIGFMMIVFAGIGILMRKKKNSLLL